MEDILRLSLTYVGHELVADLQLAFSHSKWLIEDLVTLPVHSYMVGMAFSIDAFASQGPVREIDHPPQLS